MPGIAFIIGAIMPPAAGAFIIPFIAPGIIIPIIRSAVMLLIVLFMADSLACAAQWRPAVF
jgi:hypothetical protein